MTKVGINDKAATLTVISGARNDYLKCTMQKKSHGPVVKIFHGLRAINCLHWPLNSKDKDFSFYLRQK